MSNFNFYLNRQGVRGKKGEKGDRGFSPNISIKTDTPAEFIMTVNNELDSFDTPNLIPTAIREEVTELDATVTTHTREIANLTVEVDANKSIIDANSADISRLNSDVAKNAGDISNQASQISDLTTNVRSNTNNISLLKTVSDQSMSKIIENEVNIESLKTNKQNKLKVGDNITLTDNADGTTTISAEGGGSGGEGDVTATGDNTFTGQNNFRTESFGVPYYTDIGFGDIKTLNTDIIFRRGTANGWNQTGAAGTMNDGTAYLLGFNGIKLARGSSGKLIVGNYNTSDATDKIVLDQGNVEAGDNVTIEQTTDGIKISATGGSADILQTNNIFTGTNEFRNNIILSQWNTQVSPTLESRIDFSSGNGNTFIAADGVDREFGLYSGSTAGIRINSCNSLSGATNRYGLLVTPDSLTFTGTDGIGVDLLARGKSPVADKNGIEADYKVKHGIVDCPNGLIEFSAVSRDITIKQGMVLNCAGNGTAKTTISSDITYTLTSPAGDITLFYAEGSLLECSKVDWSETEPEDNGTDNYQAWFNSDKTANPDQQWKFKSNNTGNVWRTVNAATPIVDMTLSTDGVTSTRCMGYRILDDDVLVNKTETEFIAHQALPSGKFENLTLGASGATYRAPADGYYTLGMSGGVAGSYMFIQNKAGLGLRLIAAGAGQIKGICPVVKGDVVTITYNEPNTNMFRFYYCVGSKPTV